MNKKQERTSRATLQRKRRTRRVVKAFSLGGTLQEVGDRLDVSRQRAYQLRAKYSIARRETIQDKLHSRVASECADWLDVLSPADVCELLGLKSKSDRDAMRRVVPLRNALRVRARRQAMRRMYRDSWGTLEISRTLEVCRTTVYKALDLGTTHAQCKELFGVDVPLIARQHEENVR